MKASTHRILTLPACLCSVSKYTTHVSSSPSLLSSESARPEMLCFPTPLCCSIKSKHASTTQVVDHTSSAAIRTPKAFSTGERPQVFENAEAIRERTGHDAC